MNLLLAAALAVSLPIGLYNNSAVWRPPSKFREAVLSACENSGTAFSQCLVNQMKIAGALPQAITFSHVLHDDGYMIAFDPVGSLGVAAVSYPFRANENCGIYLLNGQPTAIDVDDQRLLAQEPIRKRYPNGDLWPGDRTAPDDVLGIIFPDGSHRFVVDYRVQEGCHACAVLGHAFFGFNFDPAGKFMGAVLSGLSGSEPVNGTESRKVLSLPSNTVFTLVLASNPTTGYSWQLSPLATSAIVKSVGRRYQQPVPGRSGEGGRDLWTFRTEAAGEAKLVLAYSRPWEKSVLPIKKITVILQVH